MINHDWVSIQEPKSRAGMIIALKCFIQHFSKTVHNSTYIKYLKII